MKKYTREHLISRLQELAADLGHTPSRRELEARPDLPAFRTYHRRFGGWNAALTAAGFVDLHQGEIPKQELLDAYRRRAAELGYPPRSNELPYNRSTYLRHWQGLEQVAEAAGVEYVKGARQRRPRRIVDRDRLINVIRAAHDRLGRVPTLAEVVLSRGAFRNEFGNYTNAVREALGVEVEHRGPKGLQERML